MRYLPNSDSDRAAMLKAIGKKDAGELFEPIPAGLRLRERLRLPGPLSEPELMEFFEQASRESARDYVSLLGAGAYAHYRPVVIDALILRGEFLTSYTPYQAEISQGNLQTMFEFQTLVAQLTGMDVANSSLYDGSTAANEAVLMAMRLTRRERVVIARTVHPEYRQVIATYLQHQGVEIVEVPYAASGQIDVAALEATLNDQTAAVVVQSPNFFGALEGWPALADVIHRRGALLVSVVTEPLTLALVKPPVEADIVCGEAQSFGVPLAFGGPYVGFLATREQYVRQMPGRLVGETVDTRGRRGYCLTLATREQHIRREKATSNICTSQSLMALNAAIYLCLLGKTGLRALAEQNLAKACYAAEELGKVPGASLPFSAPHFNEFVIKAPSDCGELLAALREEKIIGGLPLERFYPELKDHLLVCVTETVPRRTIERMVEVWHRFGQPVAEPNADVAAVGLDR